jgi:hypothetical protein
MHPPHRLVPARDLEQRPGALGTLRAEAEAAFHGVDLGSVGVGEAVARDPSVFRIAVLLDDGEEPWCLLLRQSSVPLLRRHPTGPA